MELAPTTRAQRLEAPLALSALLALARDTARSCRDHPSIRLAETEAHGDGTWRYNGEAGHLSRHSLAQLCGRLELPGGGSPPAGYLARCPDPLAALHLNHWLQTAGKERRVLVRTRTGEGGRPQVRAIVSDRYAVADHVPLLEALLTHTEGEQLHVRAWSLDDEQLTLRLEVGRDHPATLKDPLRIGLHLQNSEIGLGRLRVTALITRLVCTNGLIVKAADLGGFDRRHVGRVGETLAETVREAIPRVLTEAGQALARFWALREQPLPESAESYLRTLAERAELPPGADTAALALLEGETLYDAVNAFTRLAQRYPVAERVRVETAMSRLLGSARN